MSLEQNFYLEENFHLEENNKNREKYHKAVRYADTPFARMDLFYYDMPPLGPLKKWGGLEKSFDLSRAEIIRRIDRINSSDRFFSGLSLGEKWRMFSKDRMKRKYLVCPIQKSSLGVDRDVGLASRYPLLLVEGMIITAWALGIDKGYICIDGEFEQEYDQLLSMVGEAKAKGILGSNICGKNFNFELHVHRGGNIHLSSVEQTLASLSGKKIPFVRGETDPRSYLERGYRGYPTMISSVESLLMIPEMVLYDSDMEVPTATRLLGVVGDVKKPGLKEVPVGQGLSETIDCNFFGIRNCGNLKGVLLDGLSPVVFSAGQLDSLFVGEDDIDDIIVFDNTRGMQYILRSVLERYKLTSCGRCVPGREGLKLLHDQVVNFEGKEINGLLLLQVATNIRILGKCSHCGQLANIIKSIVNQFGDEVNGYEGSNQLEQ